MTMTELTINRASGFKVQERPSNPKENIRQARAGLNGHNELSTDSLKSTMGLVVAGAEAKRSKMGLVLPGPRPGIEAMSYPGITKTEFIRVNPYVVAVDLRSMLSDVHPNWQGELLEVARQQPDKLIIPGFDDTSLVEPDKAPTFYKPTRQGVIKEDLKWFHSLFEHEIRFLAERLMKDPSMRLGVDESALNMNYTSEGPYELHIDRNPLTALLGVTDVKEGEGGELTVHEKRDEFGRPAGNKFKIRPQAGVLYFFMGRKHPHEVTPYMGSSPRVVMPGDYYSESVPEVIDTSFNEKIGLGAQILARQRLTDSGQLIVVDFTGGRGKKDVGSQQNERETITLKSKNNSSVAA